MKKKILTSVICVLLLGLTACTSTDETAYEFVPLTGPLCEDDFAFNFNGRSIELGELFFADDYGEFGYYEMPSCGYEGLDKIYSYENFEVSTRPDGVKDYVLYIDLFEDAVTARGIKIGDSQESLAQEYGECTASYANYLTYRIGSKEIAFAVDGGVISEIEYSYGEASPFEVLVPGAGDPYDYTGEIVNHVGEWEVSIAPYDEEMDIMVNQLFLQVLRYDMSQEEKLQAVYDWILENCQYKLNFSHYFLDDLLGYTTDAAKTMLNTGKGNCYNYASLQTYIFNKLNIPTILVVGGGHNVFGRFELHCWNLVYFQGKWHHFDPLYEQLYEGKYQFFLVDSDFTYNKTHTWTLDDYPWE